jgi:hypothetical protein
MRTSALTLLAALLLFPPLAVAADEPPAWNPDYTHALPDLRTARWLLTQQPGDPPTRSNEDQAIQDIDAAIATITRGGFGDHQSIYEHEQMEMAQEHGTRLHQALDLLRRAHAYLSKGVTDPLGVLIRNGALENIDRSARDIGLALEAR